MMLADMFGGLFTMALGAPALGLEYFRKQV